MRYCGPLGVPLEFFLGGPPGWSELSRQAALEWSQRESTRCPHCHTPPADWDEARGGDRRAYMAEEVFCEGCSALASIKVDNDSGTRKQLVPLEALQMWGGPFKSSFDIPRGSDGVGQNHHDLGGWGGVADHAPRPAEESSAGDTASDPVSD